MLDIVWGGDNWASAVRAQAVRSTMFDGDIRTLISPVLSRVESERSEIYVGQQSRPLLAFRRQDAARTGRHCCEPRSIVLELLST